MKSKVKSTLATGLALTLLGVTLAACGSSQDDTGNAAPPPDDMGALVEAAKSEGDLTWYNATSPATAKAIIDSFAQEYGIKVTSVPLSTADIAQRVQAEASAQDVQADVFSVGDIGVIKDFRSKDITVSLPDTWFGDMPDTARVEDAGATILEVPMVIAFSTRDGLAIDSWDDLLDPDLKGKIVISDPRATGPAGAHAQLWTVVHDAPQLGEDYIKALGEQDPIPSASAVASGEMLASGEASVSIPNAKGGIAPLLANGAPLDYWVATNPTYAYRNYAAVVADSPHPNAAALFFRYLTSEQCSSVATQAEEAFSPYGNIPGALPIPDGGVVAVPDASEMTELLPDIASQLGFN